MELKHYLTILRRWGWIMLLCMVAAGITSYIFSMQQPRVYESQARYLVGPGIDNPNVTSNDLRASSQVGLIYAELATSRPIIESVIKKLQLNADPDAVARNVTANWIDTTQILNIRVRAANPDTAARIANAIGEVLIERSPTGPSSLQAERLQDANNQIERLKVVVQSTEAHIDQLTDQVDEAGDELAQRLLLTRLEQRRAQLATAQRALTEQYAIVHNSSPNQIAVVEAALPEGASQVAPLVQQNVLAALIAGLVLGVAAMLLCEYFTDVVYTPEELRKVTGLAYLGGIVRHKKLRGTGISQLVVQASPETLAAESYRILRTNLQRVGGDSQLSSLLISSPSQGDGKSEIAANLAVSFARAGKQVILVDANLRRPHIAKFFGLLDYIGLSSLLDTPHHVLEPLPIKSIPGLSVLPAGTSALNSSEILGSEQMHQLIQRLKAQADVVILDSAPLLYSDALALASQVDGVLVAVSKGTTMREDTVKAIESLRLVGARLVGVVLNRVTPGPAYSYYPSHVTERQTVAFNKTTAAPVLEDHGMASNGHSDRPW